MTISEMLILHTPKTHDICNKCGGYGEYSGRECEGCKGIGFVQKGKGYSQWGYSGEASSRDVDLSSFNIFDILDI